jgi:hypothetical protein
MATPSLASVAAPQQRPLNAGGRMIKTRTYPQGYQQMRRPDW